MGITGHVGRVTANILLDQQLPVRAVIRNVAKGAEWQARGAQIAIADLFDAQSLVDAFREAESIFIMT